MTAITIIPEEYVLRPSITCHIDIGFTRGEGLFFQAPQCGLSGIRSVQGEHC